MASRTLSIRVEGPEDHLLVLDHLLAYHRYEGVRDGILTDLVRDKQFELHIVPGSYNVPDPGSPLWVTADDIIGVAAEQGMHSNGVSRGFRALVRTILSLQENPPSNPTVLEQLLIDAVARGDRKPNLIAEVSLVALFRSPELQKDLLKNVHNYGSQTHGCIKHFLRDRGHDIP